ncbi:unnamed protein product [Cyprideis torosa]|uniref:Uncharacterized protein n=1 Tax=Cyprideis torosa TaxID=163714 RepID=A0A7R8WJF8_9CRUS|nr:unnamed protein product [Cyprideis torosa]CAG0901946.1 unnamed protein product [Cyprideis torosa]
MSVATSLLGYTENFAYEATDCGESGGDIQDTVLCDDERGSPIPSLAEPHQIPLPMPVAVRRITDNEKVSNGEPFTCTCLSSTKADINTAKNEVELESEVCDGDRFIYTCLSNKKADINTAKNEVQLELEVCDGDRFIYTCLSNKKADINTAKNEVQLELEIHPTLFHLLRYMTYLPGCCFEGRTVLKEPKLRNQVQIQKPKPSTKKLK